MRKFVLSLGFLLLVLVAVGYWKPAVKDELAVKPVPTAPINATVVPDNPENSTLTQQERVDRVKTLRERRDISSLLVYLDPTQSALVQDSALEALTALNAFEALPQIAALGQSQDEFVLTQVMKSLGTLGGRSPSETDKVFAIEQLEVIYKRLDQDNHNQKTEMHLSNAVDAMALVPHRDSVDFLLVELKSKSENPFLQYFIVTALGRMADPRALPALDELSTSLPQVPPQPRTEKELTLEALAKAITKAQNQLRKN